jgi:hypothetical protein
MCAAAHRTARDAPMVRGMIPIFLEDVMNPVDSETRQRPDAILNYAPTGRLPSRSIRGEDARPRAHRPVFSTLLGLLAALGVASTVLSLAF